MSGKRPTNPLALAVLTLLHEEPMHPYQMSATLKERAKEQSIKLNYGSLYAVVESLQKNGYVAEHETIREGRRPERTVYTITDAGRELMVEWLTDLLRAPVREFPQFEAALSLMLALPPNIVIDLLEQRLATQSDAARRARDFMNQAYELGMPKLFAIEHEYELALLNAEVDFLTSLTIDLREGKVDGLEFWRRMHELRAQGLTGNELQAAVRHEFQRGGGDWVEKVQKLEMP